MPMRAARAVVPDRRRGLTPVLALGLLAAGALWTPGSVQAQGRSSSAFETDLALVETEVLGLERRISSLRADVSTGSLTRSPRIISERFSEAKYAYLVDDYERCALIFWSLLENDDLRGDPRRNEGQWYLAECLFQDGNLSPATDRFQTIVDQGATHPFYGDSLLKLIELFGRTGDHDKFNEYYNRFVRSSMDDSPTSLRIRYEMGKSLYRQGKLRDAQAIFAAFPRGSTYTPQARYFSGVILVAEGQAAISEGQQDFTRQRYEQAVVVFREALTLPRSTDDHKRVADLCHIAIGRLYYEAGSVPEAISEYTQVQADSDYYADALYEMIWANVEAASQIGSDADPNASSFERTRKYEEAIRAIEIFNLAFPDDRREPTLRLLSGHVRVRMEQFDAAIARYELAGDHFRELKVIVDQIVASGVDPMIYFNQLVDTNFVAEADLTVPEEARLQAAADERVAHAVTVSGDLYRQQAAIEDATDVLDLLEEALYQDASGGLIQTYRLHRQQLTSAEAAGLLLRSRLIETEVAWLEANLPASSRGDIRDLRAEIAAATGAATSVSAERQLALQKREVFNLQAQAVETRIYHLELAIKDLQGRLIAVEEYLVDARNRGERTRDQELEARRVIEGERTGLQAMQAQLREMKKSLEPRVLTGRLGADTEAESDDRGDARARLARTESRLATIRRSASGGGDFFRRLDASRSRLLDLDRLSSSARELMDRAEAAEVDDIKDEVKFQRRVVGELDREGVTIATSNEGVSGRIGERAFMNVAGFFEDMLVRADMGVADVYWYRKETTSQNREDLTRDKVRRMRALEEAFRAVLGDY